MRVFVTGTGRCGSVSFRAACKHIVNYDCGHESNCGLLEYPDNWIEVNPHLRCCIVHVARKYPDSIWVHLVRSPQACIDSLARLDDGAIMRAYAMLYPSVMPANNPADYAYRYYWAEIDSINAQLKVAGVRYLEMHLEKIKEEWPTFWELISAKGNYKASIDSWDIKRNTSEERKLS